MYTGLSNLGLSGYHSQYSELKEQAIAAARRNNASLWFAGAPADLAGFVFQDSAGTTPATGNDPIGRLVDRAGSNAATQATAANKPTLGLQANGYYGMRFDGTNDGLSLPLIPIDINSHTVIVSGNCNSASGDRIGFAQRGATTTPLRAQIDWTNGRPRYISRDDAGNVAALLTAGSRINEALVFSGSAGNSLRVLRVNGVTEASTALLTFGTTSITGNSIGQLPTNVSFMSGLLYLVCASPAFMPDADRIAIEQFAALLSGATYA